MESPYNEITGIESSETNQQPIRNQSETNQPLYLELTTTPQNQHPESVIENVAISDLRIQGQLRADSVATIFHGTFRGQACVVKRPGMYTVTVLGTVSCMLQLL